MATKIPYKRRLNRIRLSVDIPENMHLRLKDIAGEYHITVTYLVKHALARAIENFDYYQKEEVDE